MSTYTQLYYHIVFSTKRREPVLEEDSRERLDQYTGGFFRERQCQLYRINGMDEHIHILGGIRPTIAIADFVRDLKTVTSVWMKESGAFPLFRRWQDGYSAFTIAHKDRDPVIEYIKNQAEHHRKESSFDEVRRLLKEAGVEFDERYLE